MNFQHFQSTVWNLVVNRCMLYRFQISLSILEILWILQAFSSFFQVVDAVLIIFGGLLDKLF